MDIQQGTYEIKAILVDPENRNDPHRGALITCHECLEVTKAPAIYYTFIIRPFGAEESKIMQKPACGHCIDKVRKQADAALKLTYKHKIEDDL